MKKRVFAAVLSCCMLLMVCSGCGKKTIRRNEGTLNESVTSMLDKAAEENNLTVTVSISAAKEDLPDFILKYL